MAQLSIPCPRCLDNKLKLRIFGLDVGPDEEIVRWDLATDPAVNQRAHLWRNSLPAGHAADNDSDTSDAGVTNDGELSVIQGSFQSSDRIRVRWAAPRQSFHSLPMDGLLRASLDRLDAKLLIAVEQVLWHPQKPAVCAGLRLRLQYNATCRGMHFPGVATALAVDVMLDARSQTTTWARTGDHHHPRWTIDAERPAYDGVDRGDSPSHPGDLSRRTSSSSFEGGSLPGSPLSSDHPRSRIPVPAGAASLLNVPLPVDAVADYSFETRPPGDTTTPSRMSSSGISTTSGASRMSTGSASDSEAPASGRRVPAPDMRMSLHVNIDHILPKARNEENIFEYGISGVIDVFSPAAHQSAADAEEGDAPSETVFELPVFRMFQVGEETLQISVVSNVSDPIVINTGGSNSASSSAFPSTPQRGPGPSRAMRRGVQLSCPETARLIVHAPSATPSTPTLQRDRPLPGSLVETPAPADSTSQLRMPRLDVSGVNNSRTRSRAESVVLTTDFETGLSSPERPAVDIDLLPYVDVCVEPLSASRSHSVRIRIPSAAVNSDRLDFRVKTPETATEPFDLDVHLVYCALGGRLIHGRVHRSRKAEDGAIGVPASTDTWISLFLGSPLGVPAELDVLYVAKPSTRDDVETEPIPPTSMSNVCFPSFDTRVAVMRVQVLNSQGKCRRFIHARVAHTFAGCSLHQVERKDWDNFTVRSSGDLALTKFSVTGIFAPSVELAFGEAPVTQRRPITFLSTRTFFAAMLVVFITVFLAQQSGTALAPTPRPQHFPDARPEPHTDNSASVPPPTPSEVFEPAPGNYPTDVQPVSVSPLERVQAALAVKYADLNSLLRSLTTFSILSSLHRWYTGLMTWAEVALNWPNEA